MVTSVLNATSVGYIIPPILGFLVWISLALISLLRSRRKPADILFAAICFLAALFNADVALVAIIPDESLALRIDRIVHFFFVFIIPAYIRFVHAFLGIRNRRWLEWIAWLFSLIFLVAIPTNLYISGFYEYYFGRIARAGSLFHLFSVAIGFTVVYGLTILHRSMKGFQDNHRRNRIKYILGGMGFSALLLAFNILPVSGIPVYPMGNFSFIPAVFMAFGVLKYDLLDIGVLIRRGTVYFLLTGILTALYILLIFLFHALFIGSRGVNSLVLSFFLALIIVLLFNPIRVRLQELIDRLFFRGRYNYRELLREVSGHLSSLLSLSQIRELLIRTIRDALQVEGASLILAEGGAFYLYEGDKSGGTGKELSGEITPLIRYFAAEKMHLSRATVGKTHTDPKFREEMAALFDRLGASLLIPIPSREGLDGMICLGQKKSGELFVHEDLELLTTMANQAATAIENAKSYEALAALNSDLERKVEKRTAALRAVLAQKEKTQQQLIRSESLAAIGQLVAGTAHELNNPIAGAMSLVETSVETIADWEIQPDQRKEVLDDLRFSIGELRRSASIIRSLLDLSRQTQTYVEAVDMNRVLDDALRVLHNQMKNMQVEIVKEYDDALPSVEGNFANIGQVLINIIRNALQSLPAGKGRITLTTRQPSGDTVVIKCRDTGIGIPAACLKDIFKPFFTTKKVGQGTGLGLYLSHEIIRRHGGQIRVASQEGKGTVVTVELPCRRGKHELSDGG
jgi:two-component system, NtrC family, sensor kinase